jgi:adenylosuccinate synthase
VLSLELKDCWSRLQRHIVDSSFIINKAIDANKRVLFEGAQGLLIDVDHGTYPFVTSSSPSAGGVCTGAGVGPTKIKHTIGVVKAYTTRVGEGPFPTELHDGVGEDIRRRGNEFGTTTGRPRRCGWIDVVALKYAAMVNGVDSIAITKLDILDGMDEIKICYAYELDGKTLDYFPSTSNELNRVKPVYGTVPGWSSSISNITDWSLLPVEARSYICSITSTLGVPAMIIGTGPGRDKTIGGEGFWESICFDKSNWSW